MNHLTTKGEKQGAFQGGGASWAAAWHHTQHGVHGSLRGGGVEREGAGAGGDTGAGAAPGTFSTQQSHRRIHVEPSVGLARCSPTETGTSPRGLVGDAAGFRHQLSPKEEPLSRPGNTAGPHVQMPKTNPRAAPSRGVSPTDSPGFGFLQLPGPSAPSYPFPTQPWNQPWGPPLALPCLLPGPTRGVPAGTLSAPETLTRPPPLCGPPALVPHPQHQLPQCRDPQNGWN